MRKIEKYDWIKAVNKIGGVFLQLCKKEMKILLEYPSSAFSNLILTIYLQAHRITESQNGRGWKGPL